MSGAVGPMLPVSARLVTYDAVRPGPTPISVVRTPCAPQGSGRFEERQ